MNRLQLFKNYLSGLILITLCIIAALRNAIFIGSQFGVGTSSAAVFLVFTTIALTILFVVIAVNFTSEVNLAGRNDIIYAHPLTRWLTCHVFRCHQTDVMLSVEPTDGTPYHITDTVCVYCGKVDLDATKYNRQQKKYNINRDTLATKAKAKYLKHLTKEEIKERFVDKL